MCEQGYGGYDCGRALSYGCPLSCSGHGRCLLGECECDAGFKGEACDVAEARIHRGCPDNCAGHGSCFGGTCRCAEGFGGASCGLVLPASCPFQCSGHGRCRIGSCVCDAGWSGAACDTFEATTQGCSTGCSGHGVCVNATCLCDDGFGGDDCSRLRVLLGCPRGCSGRGECRTALLEAGPLPGVRRQPPPSYGLCACAPGSGGDDCGRAESVAPECPSACSGHGFCLAGGCACEAGYGGDDCALVCLGGCSGHGRCTEERECLCDVGWAGPRCEQPSACPKACSGRGECRLSASNAHEAAADARAAAEDARLAAIGAAAATTAVTEAKALAAATAAAAAVLAADAAAAALPRCVCRRGWTGPACGERTDECPVGCAGHGRCERGTCVCDPGWKGAFCATSDALARQAALMVKQRWRVRRAVPRCPNDCSGRGAACLEGTCVCERGFTGEDCARADDGQTRPRSAYGSSSYEAVMPVELPIDV